jgi:hypothetical protein
MNRLKRINRWLNHNYHFSLAIGLVIGMLIMDLLT